MQPIIKRDRVRLVEGLRPLAVPREGADEEEQAEVHEKSASLVRLGDEVQAIELRCSCGEVTVLELEFEETNPTEVSE